MIFQFHSKDTLISILIRFITQGKFNHVSIRIGKYVYEADMGKGVIKTLYSKWDNSSVVECITVKTKHEKKVVKFLNEQVGKKYDITGVLSFLLIFSKPKVGMWYCSELGFGAYLRSKNNYISGTEGQKISPYFLYIILKSR